MNAGAGEGGRRGGEEDEGKGRGKRVRTRGGRRSSAPPAIIHTCKREKERQRKRQRATLVQKKLGFELIKKKLTNYVY